MDKIRLDDLMNIVGFGTPVIVVNYKTDEEIYRVEHHTVPYSLKTDEWKPAHDYEVLCLGAYWGDKKRDKNKTLIIWVQEAEDEQ